jgi:imidazolonepropionase-like amidohydrolase
MNKSSIIIKNCHIVNDKSTEEEYNVFIENGIINYISQNDKYNNFPGFNKEIVELDADGMYLMPGLIDCHVHLILNGSKDIIDYVNTTNKNILRKNAIDNLIKSLSNGITTVRDMGCWDFIVPELKKRMVNSSIKGSRIFAAGHMITSNKGHVKIIAREIDGSFKDIKKAVDEQYVNNVDFIKLIISGGLLSQDTSPKITELNDDIIRYVVDEAKKLGLKTAVHAYGDKDVSNSIDAGIWTIEHGLFASKNTIKKAVKKNVFFVPTLKASYDILEKKDVLPAYMIKNASMVLDNVRNVISDMINNHVKICFGTDAGTPFNYHGENARELEYLSEFGMSNWDLIKAATVIPSELLGVENFLGKVKEGYKADLIILDSNPLDDIRSIRTNLRYVISDGKLCDNV